MEVQSSAGNAFCCDVAAYGTVRAAPDQLATLRRNPPFAKPPTFLKHADDQTVAGLNAVWNAYDRFGLSKVRFTDWGVLAAPRFFGRIALAGAMERFATEGAWGLSPHLIPHESMHAVSGTVSQTLEIHGPNFGVSGGPACASEIFRAAVGILEGSHVPGVWIVLTGWDPEPIPPGPVGADVLCCAVALALVPAQSGQQGLRLRMIPGPALPGLFNVETLLATLAQPELPAISAWPLSGGGRLELERAGQVFRLAG